MGLGAGVEFFAEEAMDFFPALRGDFVSSAVFAKEDGLTQVVDDHLAGLAMGEMPLELLAERGVFIAVNVLIEGGQDFFAVHVVHDD